MINKKPDSNNQIEYRTEQKTKLTNKSKKL